MNRQHTQTQRPLDAKVIDTVVRKVCKWIIFDFPVSFDPQMLRHVSPQCECLWFTTLSQEQANSIELEHLLAWAQTRTRSESRLLFVDAIGSGGIVLRCLCSNEAQDA